MTLRRPLNEPTHLSFKQNIMWLRPLRRHQSTLSFYRFFPMRQDQLPAFQSELTTNLTTMGILGRVYIATEGINGQITCPNASFQDLVQWCNCTPNLHNMEFKRALSSQTAFRKLAVRVRDQLVAVQGHDPTDLGWMDSLPVELPPNEWHEQLSGKKAVVVDMRNHYEHEIGYFEGALRPDVDTFRESMNVLEDVVKQHPNEPVYMYCTGGIRCTKAGAILAAKGYTNLIAVWT
jgi:UPF0176 protein